MIQQNHTSTLFSEKLEACLLKLSFLEPSEITELLEYCKLLQVDSFASLIRGAQVSNEHADGRSLARTLEKLANHRSEVEQELQNRALEVLDHRKPVFIAVDDYVLFKRGKHISYTNILYDHATKVYSNGHDVVDAVVSQDGQPVLSVFEIQNLDKKDLQDKKPAKPSSTRSYISKNILALIRIEQLITLLTASGLSLKKIWVLTDRWFPSEAFVTALRKSGAYFLLAIKKNATVILPDKKRMLHPEKTKTGRNKKYQPKEIKIEPYFMCYKKCSYFTDKTAQRIVRAKEAILTLKKFGRVKVFAFQLEGHSDWRYFMTNNLHLAKEDACFKYAQRWGIECLHKELKDYFGLKKSHVRLEQHVLGHFVLLYLMHAMFSELRRERWKTESKILTAQEIWDDVFWSLRPRSLEVCA